MLAGWLDIKAVAEYVSRSPWTIRVWLKNGLRYSRYRRSILLKREWIDEFLEERECTEKKVDIDGIVDDVCKGF